MSADAYAKCPKCDEGQDDEMAVRIFNDTGSYVKDDTAGLRCVGVSVSGECRYCGWEFDSGEVKFHADRIDVIREAKVGA